MECDQFAVLGLAVVVVAGGGWVHVLALPALRYGFVLAAWIWRVPATDPAPVRGDNRRGRRVCAAVVIGLLVASAPCTARLIGDIVNAIAVLLLAWSFSGDARHLLAVRTRRVT
jgi:urea transporter